MENTFLLAYIAFGGMAFTSFGMVLGYRWISERSTKEYLLSIAKEPSKCDHCKKKLNLLQCSPVIGWLSQGGKHSCGKTIPIQYPIAEIIGGSFALWIGLKYGIASGFWILPFIAGVAGAIVSDLRENEIHELHAIMIAIGAIGFSYANGHIAESAIISACVTTLFLILSYIFVKIEKMPIIPFGDVMLIFAICLSMTIDKSLVFFISLAIVSILSKKILEKFSKQGEELEGAFPLGPPICISACISMLI